MKTLFNDLRFGLRALRRMPGSALISVVVLALGIGLCSFMFSVIYGVYFRGLDVPDPSRVLVIQRTRISHGVLGGSVRLYDFADFRARQSSFIDLLGVHSGTVNLDDSEGARRYLGAFVTANTFEVLRVSPLFGRVFVEHEDAPGAPPNVVLGYAAWRDHFGRDRGAIGRAVRVNGEPAQVIGVMPEGFRFPNNHDLWIPMREDPLASARGEGRSLNVYGRLRDGVSRQRAELEMASIAAELSREYPESNEGVGIRLLTPSRATTSREMDALFGAMMVAVLSVLLIACANVANLLLARAATRTKEAAVRIALGGSRLRVMAPFLSEALLLAVAGAIAGILIAHVAIGWFEVVTAPARTGRPYFMRFHLDWPIIALVAGLIVLTALAAGLAPALQMSRTDVGRVLKDESRGSSGLRIGRLIRALVIAEVALSCALLVGAGLMTKSITNLSRVQYPFETDGLFTARVSLEAGYPDPEARRRLWDDLVGELRSIRGVAAVSLTSELPLDGENRRQTAIDGVAYETPTFCPR